MSQITSVDFLILVVARHRLRRITIYVLMTFKENEVLRICTYPVGPHACEAD
jgi:hypothetical protein